MKPSDWITVAALIIGPVLAVLTQLSFQHFKQIRDQKLWVFGTLMSNRGSMVSPDYVRALNYIDVVFYKNENVRKRWKNLLDYLGSPDWASGAVQQATVDKTLDLSAELLTEMAKDVGLGYDHTQIKNRGYYPKRLGQIEEELAELRRRGMEVLQGHGAIKVTAEPPAPAPPRMGDPR